MKTLLSILCITFYVSLNSQPSSSLVWHTDVLKAVDIAIKEKKPLFLFFTGSDWCGWCKRLQNEVFTKPQFQSWASKNVVLVELDFPRRTQLDPKLQQQNFEIAQIFGVRGYPTIWFVIPSKTDTQINFAKLGSTGYIAGGPEVWIQEANRILQSAQH
ncbi:MAG: hypothetical protein KatS3mg031_0485 [Chitinophagales bacterium]|nr:MAG: hypothetical protein KatS3mg031_0485 [Chitinophagales bacterium]